MSSPLQENLPSGPKQKNLESTLRLSCPQNDQASRPQLAINCRRTGHQVRKTNPRTIHQQTRSQHPKRRVDRRRGYENNWALQRNGFKMVRNQQVSVRQAIKQDQEQVLFIHPKELRFQDQGWNRSSKRNGRWQRKHKANNRSSSVNPVIKIKLFLKIIFAAIKAMLGARKKA